MSGGGGAGGQAQGSGQPLPSNWQGMVPPGYTMGGPTPGQGPQGFMHHPGMDQDAQRHHWGQMQPGQPQQLPQGWQGMVPPGYAPPGQMSPLGGPVPAGQVINSPYGQVHPNPATANIGMGGGTPLNATNQQLGQMIMSGVPGQTSAPVGGLAALPQGPAK